ncbi:glycoside hydrolase family 5 protein [Moniliophthora roreri MCA 2997]|uniref:glucan 1,3-beta-glucosidase n=2 Tax=Moniliophthora roreri TaxID=221103 RepID=V2WZG8_MONRO|nr:glycoside hydrolase family 5 protein [Moniliophthora roreri MCA 2997]
MTHFLLRSVITALCGYTLLSTAAPINPGFPYGSQKVRGVNIGGWLVLESWITPSLFDNTGNPDIIDEFTFGQLQDRQAAEQALKAHWDTFITEADFEAIAAAGLNHVRIPIGYWAFDLEEGEPYISGQLPYLQQAIGWAQNHGLKVIVDLHGAPGSQNGFDNSGQKLDSGPTWHKDQRNVERTNNVIKQIADLFKDNTANVPIIETMNEPAGFDESLPVIKQYFYDSYGNIRFPFGDDRQSDIVVMIADAFQPLDSWKGFMPPPEHEGVMMDKHVYQIFTNDEVRRSDEEHLTAACTIGNDLAGFELWTVIGEWSPAATDCAKNLNGRGIGSRFDGSFPGSEFIGSCEGKTGLASSFSDEYKEFLRKYWEAQIITYEKGAGWIQWAWKAEAADEWSYQAGLANGWIPQDPTDLRFANICG